MSQSHHLFRPIAYQLWKLGAGRGLSTSILSFEPPPSLPTRRVVVTGLGLVTPLGVGVERVWTALLSGATAVRGLVPEDLPEAHRKVYDQLPSKVIAAVPEDQLEASSSYTPPYDARRTSRFMRFALIAAAEALQDAQWHPTSPSDRQNTGVAIGAGMSSTTDMVEASEYVLEGKLRKLSPFFVPRILVNMAAGAVSIAHGLQGPNHAPSTACATGAHAIGDAFRMIQRGDANVMVAGGTEACIDGIALAGFSRLKALSTRFNDTPALASRPFDQDRDGFVMGEGAGVVVLEEYQHAIDRGANIYAEVRGYGMSGDAHHITQPPADGIGAQLALQRALKSGGIRPDQVSYINAHATSTPIGDDVEQQAIASVFGPEVVDGVLVSSTKGAIGHLLGAAGAVEAIFAILALHHGQAPPTVNLSTPSPHLLQGLIKSGAGVAIPSLKGATLSNSFGFGGTNTSLVFSK